jgi:hypothetical protein
VRYLLIHPTAFTGSRDSDVRGTSRAHARELQAQAVAFNAQGFTFAVAAPLTSFGPAEFTFAPDAIGFEHVPLTGYTTGREYLLNRDTLARELTQAIEIADIVELTPGGHPLPLGLIAQQIARRLGKPIVWSMPIDPGVELAARLADANLFQTALRAPAQARVLRSFGHALAEANLIITHDARVVRRYHKHWDMRGHVLERIDLFSSDLTSGPMLRATRNRMLDAGQPVRFGMTGSLPLESGADLAIRAVAKLAKLAMAVRLVLPETTPLPLRALVDRLDAPIEFGGEFDVLLAGVDDVDAASHLITAAARAQPAIVLRSDSKESPASAPPLLASVRLDADLIAQAMLHADTHRESTWRIAQLANDWVRARTHDTVLAHRAVLARTLTPAGALA